MRKLLSLLSSLLLIFTILFIFPNFGYSYKYKSMIATQAALIIMSDKSTSTLAEDVFKWTALCVEGDTVAEESTKLSNVFESVVNDIDNGKIITIDQSLDELSIRIKATLGNRFNAWSEWMDKISERFAELDAQNKVDTLPLFKNQLIKIQKGLQ